MSVARCVLVAAAAVAVATARSQIPNEFMYNFVGEASSSLAHRMAIYISPRDQAESTCSDLLMQVSDPASPSYGKHLSFEDMAMFADKKHTRAVMQFVKRNFGRTGIIRPSVNGEFVEVIDSIQNFENAFSSRFYEFAHAVDGYTSFATDGVLPKELAGHVDFISGFNYLPANVRNPRYHTTSSSGMPPLATPAVLYKYYGFPTPLMSSVNSSMAVFASINQSFVPSDLALFQTTYGVASTPVTTVIGPNYPDLCAANANNCDEASLDVQQMSAFAPTGNLTFFSIALTSETEDIFLVWIETLINMTDIPKVHSISYGQVTEDVMQADKGRLGLEICKIGLRGASVFVSSGDDGVIDNAGCYYGTCEINPSFPATCPYVTAVGATQGAESNVPETAAMSNTGAVITTGGGFSIYYPIPSWQATQVANYLATAPDLPPSYEWNQTGRGYPDVAFAGFNFPDIIDGMTYSVCGTSCSSPSFAGMIAQINSMRLAAKKPSLGFLNPALYSSAFVGAFRDITVGRNNCCAAPGGYEPFCCTVGFNATVGWDPLTGLGSPNYPVLSKLLLAL